jgi:hypothetical protein
MDSALASLKKLTLAARGSSGPDNVLQVKPAAAAAPAKGQQQQQQQQVAAPQQKVAASQQNGAKKQPGLNLKTLPHTAANQPHGIASPAQKKPANPPAIALPVGQKKPVNAQGAAPQQTKPANTQGVAKIPVNPQGVVASSAQKKPTLPRITTRPQQGDAVAPSPKTALPKALRTPKFRPKTPTVQVTA